MDKSILSSLLKMNKSDILKALYEFRENEGDIITAEFKEEVREMYNINNVEIMSEAKVEREPANINHKKDVIAEISAVTIHGASNIEKMEWKLSLI